MQLEDSRAVISQEFKEGIQRAVVNATLMKLHIAINYALWLVYTFIISPCFSGKDFEYCRALRRVNCMLSMRNKKDELII